MPTPSDFELDDYISNYDGTDQRIAFAWNGEHGETFRDENHAFRNRILDRALQMPDDAPLALFVNLYRALTAYSKEAWSIDMRIGAITEAMLAKGRGRVAGDYLTGAMQSFDAYCATAAAQCPLDVAEECLAIAKEKLAAAINEDEKAIWEFGVQRFSEIVERSKA